MAMGLDGKRGTEALGRRFEEVALVEPLPAIPDASSKAENFISGSMAETRS